MNRWTVCAVLSACLATATGVGTAAPDGAPAAPAARSAPVPAALRQLEALAVHSGQDALLPPHLSLVLGLGAHLKGLPVRQLMVQRGQQIRVFNVSVAHPHALVILSHDDSARTTSAYLLSARGVLIKAVTFADGGPSAELVNAAARAPFADELAYWLAIARKGAP